MELKLVRVNPEDKSILINLYE
ncbi:GNAT family N-acetyltransferase, partial [Clostridioides difficile]